MTEEEATTFLKKLRAEINKNTEFSSFYPIDEEIVNFIWVSTKDERIGNCACHYEVIFNDPKDGNPDVASVEVHFETPTYKSFQGIELPAELAYGDWGRKDGRIIFKDMGGDKKPTKPAVIERLRELERLVGRDLRAAFDSQLPQLNPEQGVPVSKSKRGPTEVAKEYVGYKCEICPDHETFIDKTGKVYMETHHLIPLSKQADFDYSLGQEQNLVCLCPNCHEEIHNGMNRMELVEELWNQRKKRLKAAGIGINLTDLKAYYS